MRMFLRVLKYIFLTITAIVLSAIALSLYLYWTRDSRNLEFLDSVQVVQSFADSVICETVFSDGPKDTIRRKYCNSGMIETGNGGNICFYAHGTPFEIGSAMGRLAPELLYYQEKVFIERIKEMVPSDFYLGFLRVMLGVFNRNLASNIPDEYKTEIYAFSQYCTDEFNIIGSPYDRQLNYHAAHDIGHAMQRYMLVGCSSFGVWGERSANGNLLIGRNFDFYVGDDFAKNRLVSVIRPEKGFGYISVSWPGMIGVLSGMNEKGLTVTLNAAQGDIPRISATPVSILAREILQYASNIEEAVAIAGKYRTFTSEQFLIGSAADGCCATIEKSPEKMCVVYGEKGLTINTNHFRGGVFADDKWNMENIENSDSRYRYERIEELADSLKVLDTDDVAYILRDRRGHGGKDIGYTNQKSVNQLIANHSVIFEPEKRNIWIAGGRGWQYGAFLRYNLDSVLATGRFNSVVCDIAADSLFLASQLDSVILYRNMARELVAGGSSICIERFISLNPQYYNTWVMAAEEYAARGDYGRAAECCRIALEKEIATRWERSDIEKKLEKFNGLLKSHK